MDFTFDGMTMEEAKEKCRRMFADIAVGEPIANNSSLIAFLANDPGLANRRASLKGDVKYYRRINKRHGGTTFYLIGDGGASTYASWPSALAVVMGKVPKQLTPWTEAYNAIYAKVSQVIYDMKQDDLILEVTLSDMISDWMKERHYDREDVILDTEDKVDDFGKYFRRHAKFVPYPKRARAI